MVLDADLIKDCGLVSFAKKYPDRFIECGIAEQDMVSMAGGMARRGALPVVHSFACFLSARPNEQIYNQCSEGSKVDLRGLACRPDARRARALAPVGARHLARWARCRICSLAEPALEAEVHALFDYAGQHAPTRARICGSCR